MRREKSPGSEPVENIAQRAHRAQRIAGSGLTQCAAQAADPDVHRAFVNRRVLLAQRFDQLKPREYPPRVLDQKPQQPEFVRHQRNGPSFPARLKRRDIDRQFAKGQQAAGGRLCQPGLRREQPVENLGAAGPPDQIVICARPHRPPPALRIALIDQDRDMRLRRARIAAHPATQFQPGNLRHRPLDKRPQRTIEYGQFANRHQPVKCNPALSGFKRRSSAFQVGSMKHVDTVHGTKTPCLPCHYCRWL